VPFRGLLDIEDCAEALSLSVMEIRYFAEADAASAVLNWQTYHRDQGKAGQYFSETCPHGKFFAGHGEDQKRRIKESRCAL